MKKILSSVIIISMCLALVSCSGSTGNSSGEDIEIAKPDCADISTETYEDNALTMTVPSGWTVETYGSMGEYSIRCFDPADKSRQIFCYGCLSPILKSKEAKEWYRQYSQATGGGYGSDLFAPAVVLSSGRATDIFKKFDKLTEYVNTIGSQYSNFKYPVMDSFKVIEEIPYSTPMASYAKDEGCIRATFDSEEGTFSEGLFAATLVDAGSYEYFGADTMPLAVYCATGVSASAEDFLIMQDMLLECVNSISFKDSFIQQANAYSNSVKAASLNYAAQVNSAIDSYMQSWENRQITNDRIAEKQSDAILGYDRLYDSSTGETYRAETGWYEMYDADRGSYSNTDIYMVEDDALYDKAYSGTIMYK